MFRLLPLSFVLIILVSSCGKKHEVQFIPPNVQTKKAQQGTVPILLQTVGNVLANINVNVTPQVGGQIESVYVKEGQKVTAGELLYVIDPRPYQAQLLQAEGTLAQDQANLVYQKKSYERNSHLVAQDFISKINMEQIESNVKQAEGAVEKDEGLVAQAKINLEWCYIRSPIEGKISYYNIDIGNVVAPNDPTALTTIRQIRPIQVQFTYTQREFEEIQRQFGANPFEFSASLLESPQEKIKGQVYFFDNNINTNTGTILLKGRVPNEDEKLWPGAFVRVGMLLKMQENAITVPIEAVDRDQNGFFLFVVKNDIAELRQIEMGRQVDQSYIVLKGINPGEDVITMGQINVKDGMKVNVNNREDTSAEEKSDLQLRM